MQVALFLHTLADDALRVYNGFQFDNDDSERTVNDIIEKFEDFAVGEVNETYERYLFNRRCQEEGEVFDKFLSDPRSLIKTCSYCNQWRTGPNNIGRHETKGAHPVLQCIHLIFIINK